jgi:hypothetical protein
MSVVDRVRGLRNSGLTLEAIVKECNRLGLRSRAGKPFRLTQICRMLVRVKDAA